MMRYTAFFRPRCLICSSALLGREGVCDLCEQALIPMESRPHCKRCGEILLGLEATVPECGLCIANPPHFSETHACFVYEDLIGTLIRRLKFSHQLNVLPFLVKTLEQKLRLVYSGRDFPDFILPVPLQYKRQFWRGFNQSHEIGRRVAECLNGVYDTGILQKMKATAAQSDLSRGERQRNLTKSFAVSRPLNGASIAIVDDVMTTGATLREIARVLHLAGAEEVHVWIVARTSTH